MNSMIDPALVARIAREVIAKLRQVSDSKPSTQTNKTAISIDENVITAATIEQLTGTHSQVFVSAKAIVTPAANDAARERNITINRSVELPPAQIPKRQNTNTTNITGESDLAAAVTAQLARRGIESTTAAIVLSDTPANEVFRYCSDGKRAVMIGAISDVNRFFSELNPDVWVLDTKRMNLVALVNATAMIARK